MKQQYQINTSSLNAAIPYNPQQTRALLCNESNICKFQKQPNADKYFEKVEHNPILSDPWAMEGGKKTKKTKTNKKKQQTSPKRSSLYIKVYNKFDKIMIREVELLQWRETKL